MKKQKYCKTHLILGGARAGKTKFAQNLALKLSKDSKAPPIYIATGQALDPEMEERIRIHKIDRGEDFQTKECPLNLSDPLLSASSNDIMLIDCLTLFVSNLLCAEKFDEKKIVSFLNAIKLTKAQLIIVSNETGMGIVPDNKLTRDFRDISGNLNQKVAQMADKVTLMVAGIPVQIKN